MLRNPWNKFEWKGDWSDASTCWTKEARKKHKVVEEDDGCFWMSWLDMKRNFEKLQICKVQDNSCLSSFKIEPKKDILPNQMEGEDF
jgi:hypothetical protein